MLPTTAGQPEDRRVGAVTARALGLAVDLPATPALASAELSRLAGGRVWVLEQALGRVARGLHARPSPRGERAHQLLHRALRSAESA